MEKTITTRPIRALIDRWLITDENARAKISRSKRMEVS
jgi:hypothetical protein